MKNEGRTPFGKRLFDSRTNAGLTQEEVAKKIGMSQGTLAEAEISGKRSGYTPQLATMYKVSAHWLATGRVENDISLQHSDYIEGTSRRVEEKLAPDAVKLVSKIKSQRDKDVEEIASLARKIDATGIGMLLKYALDLAEIRPAKQTQKFTE